MAITKQNIIDYVRETHYNINPAVLSGLLESYQAGDNPELQTANITPGTTSKTVEPEDNYGGFSSVTVEAVTAAIDANIVPENIKKGVTILGVEGTYEGETQEETPGD